MAVYEHLYGAYEGEAQSAWSRSLVIPRYALREVFKSKLFTTIYILCFIYPLIAAILVYLHHNSNALALLQINVQELLPIDASFFRTFLEVQGAFSFILTVLVAPPLISRDLANNALPLYLSRPLSRVEYVLGKMAVVGFLLSLVTWVPGSLIFLFQASLGGFTWLWSNFWMLGAIFVGSMVWIILLSLIALSISSLVKWRVVASGAILGLFFVPSAFGEIINNLFLNKKSCADHPAPHLLLRQSHFLWLPDKADRLLIHVQCALPPTDTDSIARLFSLRIHSLNFHTLF